MIEICTIGGYQNVGRNMTAVKYKEEVVIIDMGLDLEQYIEMTEDEDAYNLSTKQLAAAGAIPNDAGIKHWKDKVIAIIPTHAHLDHVGAIPFLSNKYNCKILCTPFTASVIERISEDEKRPLSNKIRVMSVNSTYQLSQNINIEFINITHSTPHAVIVAVHTPEGTVVYANDFKFDDTPILGDAPNKKRLDELKNVKVLILDSLYSHMEGHTPSESVARDKLKEIIETYSKKDNIIIATTFSSHIARLKTLVELAKKVGRKPIFLGRSLSKYVYAAQDAGLVRFEDDCEIVKYSSKVKKALRRMNRDGANKYLIICSGHQAEPRATLTRMIGENLLNLDTNDVVIFSSTVIPNEINFRNREKLESEIKKTGATLFTNIHSSGHASQEDIKELIELVNPENIIPAHADIKRTADMGDFCKKWTNIKVITAKEGDFLEF